MYARNSGILIAYSLGSYFTYIQSSFFFTGSTLIFLVAIWFVPSTPQYFLHKNKVESAQQSFNFYNKHRLQSDPKFCMVQFESLKDCANMVKSNSRLTWKAIGEYFPCCCCCFRSPVKFRFVFLYRFSKISTGIFASDCISVPECIDRTNHFFDIWIGGDRQIRYACTGQYGIGVDGSHSIGSNIHHIQIDRS